MNILAFRSLKQITFFALLLLIILSSVVKAEENFSDDENHSPRWVVDPKFTGSDIPPAGRSLFDFIITENHGAEKKYNIPFPFSSLLEKIEKTLKSNHGYPGIKKVLIPLGRSLQRPAAGKEFFNYPRAVAVIDTEAKELSGHAGMLLKDRLYIGYHEKSNILEIISYNEAAGRFEFQLVKDYHESGSPEVFYAPRAICIACHQNHSPLFSRPTWDETSANPTIKKYLKATGKSFYGINLDHGIDIPNAIDKATDRANLFSLQQWLWRGGCGLKNNAESTQCRAGLLTSMLQYRLSGQRHFDRSSAGYIKNVLPVIKKNWPSNIAIPNPDIPNRNPFLKQAKTKPINPESVNLTNVETSFEPVKTRQPLEIWKSVKDELIVKAISGLSGFIAESDIRRVDRHLRNHSSSNTTKIRQDYKVRCKLNQKTTNTLQRIGFNCTTENDFQPRVSIRGRFYISNGKYDHCAIEQLMLQNNIFKNIRTSSGNVSNDQIKLTFDAEDLFARLDNGQLLESLVFKWQKSDNSPSTSTTATLTLVNDFTPVTTAVNALNNQTLSGNSDVLSSRPFSRSRVMSRLFEQMGMPELTWCCNDATGMPPAKLELQAQQSDHNVTPEVPKAFIENCAQCHYSREHFPPNFLFGDTQTVNAKLAQCAERIYYRLSMWQLPAARQPKTPMPPDLALLRHNIQPDKWKTSPGLHELKNHIGTILKEQTGKTPRIEDFINRDYETLRLCLN